MVVITFEYHYPGYCSADEPDFPHCLDLDKKLYHHYGMDRGNFRDIWSWKSLKVYCRLLLKGGRLLKSRGDIYQLGGDVLVDPAGIVRFHHISRGPDDRPEISDILSFVSA